MLGSHLLQTTRLPGDQVICEVHEKWLVANRRPGAKHRVTKTQWLALANVNTGDTVRDYSGGMIRRLNLGLGLVHEPRVLLLDEPTVGIDPQARANLLDIVRQTAAAGTTVLYTTHYLEEAERLCDRIGIMDHGRLLAEGDLDELKKMVGEEETVMTRPGSETERSR